MAVPLETNLSFLAAARAGSGRYRSCRWVEEGAFITSQTVNMCCMESIGNSTPVLFPLEGEPPSPARIIQARDKLRLENQTDKAPCAGCYELREAEWEAKDFFGFIAIAGFMHCNLACSYCVNYQFDPSDRGSPVADMVRDWIAQGMLRPSASSIDWGGGESTLHRDFEETAALAFENGIFMLIFTNGTGFSKSIADGLSKRLAFVVCSVDAGTAKTYERIKGKNVLDAVWSTLSRYAALCPDKVLVKYILMESNTSLAELDEFLSRSETAGVKELMCSLNVVTNVSSSGHANTRIILAAAYLMRRWREQGNQARLADVFSLEDRQRVDDLVADAAIGIDELRERLADPDGDGVLDVSFMNNETFLKRFHLAAGQGDRIRVVLGNPANISELPTTIGLLLASALPDMFQGHDGGAPDDPLPPGLGKMVMSEWGRAPALLPGWQERLAYLRAFDVAVEFDQNKTAIVEMLFAPRMDAPVTC